MRAALASYCALAAVSVFAQSSVEPVAKDPECAPGFRAAMPPEVRKEVRGVMTEKACSAHCHEKEDCTMYHFGKGVCSIRQRGYGATWCRRESEHERAIRIMWEKGVGVDRWEIGYCESEPGVDQQDGGHELGKQSSREECLERCKENDFTACEFDEEGHGNQVAGTCIRHTAKTTAASGHKGYACYVRKAPRGSDEWSVQPDLPQVWCNTGELDFGEKGFAIVEDGADSLGSCQRECDDDDDCVGVSFFAGDGSQSSRVGTRLDKVLGEPCSSAGTLWDGFWHFSIQFDLSQKTSTQRCDSGFDKCINRPYDISDITEATGDKAWWDPHQEDDATAGTVKEQCIKDQHVPKCTKCYRIVAQCFVHGDAKDCTTLEMAGQPGGTYIKPQKACPSRIGDVDECASSGWIFRSPTKCSEHEGGASCDSGGQACSCRSKEAPCAQKLMGAKKKSLRDLGYGSYTQQTYDHVVSSENEFGQCVSEEEYCKVRTKFSRHSPAVAFAVLQANLVAITILEPQILSATKTVEDKAQDMVCEYLSPVSVIEGKLGALQAPTGMVMARVFGMLVCYTEMIASDDDDRGRQFGHCMVRAVLHLVTYLALQYTGMGQVQQAALATQVSADGLEAAADAADEALDEVEEGSQTVLDVMGKHEHQETFDHANAKVQEAAGYAEQANSLANESVVSKRIPQWKDWNIDDAMDMVQATAQVLATIASAIETLENMIVEIGAMVVTTVLDRTLDLNTWAEGQPKGIDIDGYFCDHLSGPIIEDAFSQMRKMTKIIAKEMKGFIESQSSRLTEGKVNACTRTPQDSICGVLGHNYDISIEFRDVSNLQCQEKVIRDQYRALVNSEKMRMVLNAHSVCLDSLRDLLCLSAFPGCAANANSGCDQFTACKIACRNLNTCATSLAFKKPFDCDLQCACATDCVKDDIENGLQVHAQELYRCNEMCDKDKPCEEECMATFQDNKKEACQAATSWDMDPKARAAARKEGKPHSAVHSLFEIPGYRLPGPQRSAAPADAGPPWPTALLAFAIPAVLVGAVTLRVLRRHGRLHQMFQARSRGAMLLPNEGSDAGVGIE